MRRCVHISIPLQIASSNRQFIVAICTLKSSAARSQRLAKIEPLRAHELNTRESQLFTLIAYVQFELKSFKGHQHAPKLLPRDLSTVDNEEWYVALLRGIPFNPAFYDLMVSDL